FRRVLFRSHISRTPSITVPVYFLRYLNQLTRLRPTLPMNHRTLMYTKQATYSKATALGVNTKMASESENRDADSASRPTSDPPYYYVQDFYTLSDKVSDSKNLSFLCKLCPPKKFAIIKKKKKMN